jgi:deoxyribonuclease-4
MHIRVNDTLSNVARKAIRMGADFFQCFLTVQATGKSITITPADQKEFVALCRDNFQDVYAHASYWSNLASPAIARHYVLERELQQVHKLGFTHLIVHPGSAKGAKTREEGIDAVARSLNRAMKNNTELTFVVENTAHGNMAIGSDINELGALLQKMDQPERLKFCIDTAHAYVYGYNITDNLQQDAFIDLVNATIGIDRVVLIHLNDTYEECASKIDRHASFFNGVMGQEPLRRFAQHPLVRHIPMMPELPVVDEATELDVLTCLKSWSL